MFSKNVYLNMCDSLIEKSIAIKVHVAGLRLRYVASHWLLAGAPTQQIMLHDRTHKICLRFPPLFPFSHPPPRCFTFYFILFDFMLACFFCVCWFAQTSVAATSTIYQLSQNPDKQEILFNEIKRSLPTPDTKFTISMLETMPYLRACIKETLRWVWFGWHCWFRRDWELNSL